ncbi:MAG: hypothetical protein PHQ36_13465, partial [Anaerolineales bacterium]|nr:hypothetical protein [Anaerolineales bacterium]
MIKKINLLLACSLVLTACSFSAEQIFPLAPTRIVTSTPTRVLSPTPTDTITPTHPTPTFTLTPTLVGYKSPTPTSEDTATPTATITSAFDSVTPSTPTPIVKMEGFVSIKISSNVFYRGNDCEPTSVKFVVLTANSAKADFVVLSTRFISRATGVKSNWSGITMLGDGLGTYTYELLPEKMEAINAYIDPWVQFQFVATDKKGNR